MKRQPPKNDAQIDLFIPMFGDIASRDGLDLMEFPFFSLSKQKRFEPIEYQNESRGISITVSGGKPNGIATIWDKDVLIWCISQVVESLDRGEKPDKTVYFHPFQMLKAIRRDVGKTDYKRLENAFIRLLNTSVHTSHRTDDKTARTGFHWIENYRTATENKSGEGVGMWSITISDWIYKAALNKRLILTLDDDYFLLTGGLERWLYGIARKHGGYQDAGFAMPMKTLYAKSGSMDDYKGFRRGVMKIVKVNELPSYHLQTWRGKDKLEYISFTRRSNLSFDHPGYDAEIPRAIRNMAPKG